MCTMCQGINLTSPSLPSLVQCMNGFRGLSLKIMERGHYTLTQFIDNLGLKVGQSQRILGTAHFEIKPYKDKDTIRCWITEISKNPKLDEYHQIVEEEYEYSITVSHSLSNFDLGCKIYTPKELEKYMTTDIHYFNL